MSKKEYIEIRGAEAHNLRGVNVDIPRGEFVVVTGLSGSGKSSLAFDTIYAEGQRRYMDTLSTYAKHFMGVLEKREHHGAESDHRDRAEDHRKQPPLDRGDHHGDIRFPPAPLREGFEGIFTGHREGDDPLHRRSDHRLDNE